MEIGVPAIQVATAIHAAPRFRERRPTMPARLTDEEIVLAVILRKDSAKGYESVIAAVLAKLEYYPHRQQVIEDARRIERIVAEKERIRIAGFVRTHKMTAHNVAPHHRVERVPPDAATEALADAILRDDGADDDEKGGGR
jgi:hypothetical protein